MTTKESEPKAQDIDIVMISANANYVACRLKEAQMFVISMRNIQYQAEKEVRTKTNPKNIVLQEYHDFLDVSSKKNSDTFSSYQKYDHKIHLEKEQKPGHAPLYMIFSKELDTIKRILILIQPKDLFRQAWYLLFCQYFLLKNQEEEFDFVLITKD